MEKANPNSYNFLSLAIYLLSRKKTTQIKITNNQSLKTHIKKAFDALTINIET